MLAFVHVSKTAGSTFTQILRRSFGARHCDVRLWPWEQNSARVASADDLRRLRSIYWRLASIAGHDVVPYGDLRRECPNIRFYTFFREPLTRFASHYQSVVQKRGIPDRFFDWLGQRQFWNWHTQKLAGCDDADLAIEMLNEQIEFVGITEQFDESLVMFRRWAADPSVTIAYESRNVARDNSIKNRLLNDPASRSAMMEANQHDLRLYHHVIDSIFPQQQQAYGESLAEDVSRFQEDNSDDAGTLPLLGTLVRDLVYKPLLPFTTRGRVPDESTIPRKRAA